MNVGDRVAVTGSLTHRHGEHGVIAEIADSRDQGAYTHRVEFAPNDSSWFLPFALRVMDAVELLGRLAPEVERESGGCSGEHLQEDRGQSTDR